MNQSDLSLEQQFHLRTFSEQVNRMSREQAQDFLIELRKQMMIRENAYQLFLKHDWGLETNSASI